MRKRGGIVRGRTGRKERKSQRPSGSANLESAQSKRKWTKEKMRTARVQLAVAVIFWQMCAGHAGSAGGAKSEGPRRNAAKKNSYTGKHAHSLLLIMHACIHACAYVCTSKGAARMNNCIWAVAGVCGCTGLRTCLVCELHHGRRSNGTTVTAATVRQVSSTCA